jgi:elongation factor Ts
VANNENFVALVESILDLLASNGIAPSMDDLNSQTQQSIDSLIQEHVLTLGENIQLGKAFVTDRSGFIYNHTGNNISTIVYGNGSDDVLKEVALQITAMNPQYLSRDDVPNDIIDSLRAAAEQELE